ncbi:unnamed protein product [Adineta steineri]|uniref:Uncharacterized protein n=1 Tax=Adineta steineri TaxID=433720 RepID=A0A819F8A1_9BILA|nr:unnamed protein product [Adineta steineri]CAF3863580.1 unnamed protein product [Adineta steineri]
MAGTTANGQQPPYGLVVDDAEGINGKLSADYLNPYFNKDDRLVCQGDVFGIGAKTRNIDLAAMIGAEPSIRSDEILKYEIVTDVVKHLRNLSQPQQLQDNADDNW